MLDRTNHNALHDTRFGIGGNNPPEELEAIEPAPPSPLHLAKEGMAALSAWMTNHPVIETKTHADEIKPLIDRLVGNCTDIEHARDTLVRPLNEKVATINAEHKAIHNTDKKRPGLADKLLIEAYARGTAYLKKLEAERMAAAEAAEAKRAEAERIARELDRKAQEAALEAQEGVCVDIGQATIEADQAFAAFEKAGREAARAERETKVRIAGGYGHAIGLRTVEALTVTDWQAAIEDIGLTHDIVDAILKGARAYRRENHELPAGITSTDDRKI